MSGEAIVWYLLKTNSSLTDVVPAARIQCDTLPLNTTLPAISIQEITAVPNNTLAMAEATYVIVERVQITVAATTRPQVRSILALIRAALPVSIGNVNGFTCQGIVPDAENPAITDKTNLIYSQSQDYMVAFAR